MTQLVNKLGTQLNFETDEFSTMAEPAKWTSPRDFLFGTPLYERVALSADRSELRQLFVDNPRFDAHCPHCGKEATFDLHAGRFRADQVHDYIDLGKSAFQDMTMTCAREKHRIFFWVLIFDNTIQKAGQYPSFADIANDESKKYRKALSKENSTELHKAIGLAAHGVGIGSLVYLRRIFERLVYSRFKEFKGIEAWDEAEFLKLRMNEKIDFLKDHLPAFMVNNSKIYSILSLGVHELSEQASLAVFDVMKQSIFFILDEDIKKKEELAAKAAIEQAIAKFKEPAK